MTAFVLHTGVSKTGSTTLQSGFARHSGVHYLGKSADYDGPEGSRSEEVFRSLNAVIWQRPLSNSDPSATPPLADFVTSPEAAGRVTIASWEGLGSRPTSFFAAMLGRVQVAWPETHLLCCLRSPASWLVSTYLQHLRGQFFHRHRDDLFGGQPWIPFEQWLERSAACGYHGLTAQLPNMRSAVTLLGPLRVHVCAFERLRSQPEAYYRELCQAVGIDAEEMLNHLREEHRNPRLTQTGFDAMRHVAATPSLSDTWRQQTPNQRRAWLHSVCHQALSREDGMRLMLPPRWQREIDECLADDMAWLRTTFGVPEAGSHRKAC